MKTTKEKIEVMQAFEDGEDCELKSLSRVGGLGWDDLNSSISSWTPVWVWDKFDYRIKPKSPIVRWAVYRDGLYDVSFEIELEAQHYVDWYVPKVGAKFTIIKLVEERKD